MTVTNSGIVTTNFAVITNYFSDSFPILAISDLFISGNVLKTTNAIGVNLTSTNSGMTNIINVSMFGVTLQSFRMQGSNTFGILTGTNILGAGSLGAGIILTNSGFTNVLIANLSVPGGIGAVFNTNLVNVINTNLFKTTGSGIYVQITTVLNILITDVPHNWSAVASSADGSHLAAADNGGFIYISTNSGTTWLPTSASGTNWSALVMSADGGQITAAVNGGLIYSSSDAGSSWVAANIPASNWRAVDTSADGAELVAVVHGGVIYTEQSSVITSHTVPVPVLQIRVANGNVVLSWATGATNVVLQQSSDITGMAWGDLSTTPVWTNGQNQVTLPMVHGQYLYRLKQP
jgi:hypothetical protein